jgi:hypothetical protein
LACPGATCLQYAVVACDISEAESVELRPCKPGLGQGVMVLEKKRFYFTIQYSITPNIQYEAIAIKSSFISVSSRNSDTFN